MLMLTWEEKKKQRIQTTSIVILSVELCCLQKKNEKIKLVSMFDNMYVYTYAKQTRQEVYRVCFCCYIRLA